MTFQVKVLFFRQTEPTFHLKHHLSIGNKHSWRLFWVIVMWWFKAKRAEYSSLHTPNICRRSGSRKRKGMLDTWRRLGVPLSSASTPADPPPPPTPDPTPDWPSIWEDTSDCWNRGTGTKGRDTEDDERVVVLGKDDIYHQTISICHQVLLFTLW